MEGFEVFRIQNTTGRDFATFACAAYVFEIMLKEPWYHPFDGDWFRLHSETPFLLREKGYLLTDRPEPGNLVTYITGTTKNNLHANHFGLYLGGDKVISKFGYGELLEHPLDKVSTGYGREVLIFRKHMYTLSK